MSQLTLTSPGQRWFTDLTETNILLHFIRSLVPAKTNGNSSSCLGYVSISAEDADQSRCNSQVVEDSALPHGHTLGLRVETGAGMRHSLARCKQRAGHKVRWLMLLRGRSQGRRQRQGPHSPTDWWFSERNFKTVWRCVFRKTRWSGEGHGHIQGLLLRCLKTLHRPKSISPSTLLSGIMYKSHKVKSLKKEVVKMFNKGRIFQCIPFGHELHK